MNYDFDKIIDRRGTNSVKWDVGENELPMWVADMDFETAPEIKEVIQKRAAHGVYGYATLPDEWYAAYQDWWKKRHHFAMEKDWLLFTTGVIPAISSIVRKLTTPAEKVVLMTPVYNVFFNSVLNNGRQVLESPLRYDGKKYDIDFEVLEAALSDPQTSMLILCNPQNPSGNIWSRESLERIGNLCAKYHVLVVSDEIHCDVTAPWAEYVPFASVSEVCRDNSITCIAPTKTFNLAGIKTAAVCVPNANLRHKVWRGLNTDEVAEANVFAPEAAAAAFTKGGPWLDELRQYLWENRRTAEEYLVREIPAIHAVKSDATYLMWADCSEITGDALEMCKFIRERTGLFITPGGQYHGNGQTFVRINLACPKAVVQEGMERLKNGVELYGKRTTKQRM